MDDGPPGEQPFYDALADDDPDELYEESPCAYLSTRGDGTILKVNRTFSRWTGYPPEALVGRRRFQDLLTPGDRIYYETHVAPLLAMQGSARELALELVCSSGGRLPMLVWSSLKRDPSGGPTVIRSALFDATERRAYEQELLREKGRAEEAEAKMAELARTLQETFLPPSFGRVPGLDIAGAYRPAGDGTIVGGDFYDLFQTSDQSWAIVLGDVCGKGAPAASLTALVRYTVRAESLRERVPSSVLEHVHEVVRNFRPADFCTAVLVSIELEGDRPTLVVSSGGHPLPWHIDSSGAITTLGKPGALLGMIHGPKRQDTRYTLEAGETVVLYTDGVTEGSRDAEFYGSERLGEVIEEVKEAGAREIAEAIVDSALEFQHGHSRDDIAVVVVKALADSPGQ